MQQVNSQLDARGMSCPLPILKTRKAMAALGSGEILEVTATDPGSVKDMGAYCEQTGHELLASDERDGAYVFLIRKA